ncbi:MAG: bifunctional tRNA ((5)s(2)U34)-methyltransferase/FAD-dependent cmnm(5)s(2)U34 oxidoreductase [Gemmataceae bacterium]|nr:bifunctional tRNA ((5)s(2)U34)-methyltransferase/FAD-dependent cmnm(5)s(2)U34 oxidoreductase [Gemmataceae bacterium]
MRTYDHIVIGHGLAGAAVAWCLRWKGRRVLVIDREGPGSASRVAAGLITPITGRRLAKTWRLDDLFPAAAAFYRRVETATGARFFASRDMVRLFADDRERTEFEGRDDPTLRAIINRSVPLVNISWFDASHGGFEMASAARLDVPRYLDASREQFTADGSYLTAEIDPPSDLDLAPGGVVIPRFEVRAEGVIFCQGLAARDDPWFPEVRFTPAKGEVLTIRVPGLGEDRVVHRGIWLAPLGGDVFRAGATYDRADLDPVPTRRGREEICTRLREFLRLPFEVIDHSAGVRPIVEGGKPILGIHPEYRQLTYLNGLGSKGALLAPFFATQLIDHTSAGRAIDPDVAFSPGRTLDPSTRVVERAHAAVRASLGTGEVAIDATAGNGRDTAFLAELVGPAGRVFAIDVQPLALARTAAILRERSYSNVTLVQRDHAELADLLPKEHHGRVGAVMFNPGLLPGGDRSIPTSPGTTAIRSALDLLRPGGVVTVVTYPGSSGDTADADAVRMLLESLPATHFEVRAVGPERPAAPRLFVIRKGNSL